MRERNKNTDYSFKPEDISALKKLGLVIDGQYESHEDVDEIVVSKPDGSSMAAVVYPYVICSTESRIRTILMPSRQVFEELTGSKS